eukprot:TRINITY_DN81899_c0_g1_i1.p1 TRINITY_DN81899_c0_g1~~TRINITY_DN81899_c0_g1_i1.p1  ORF type:complete len:334 (+),score=41.23 TRINITY_DN81899_c0_g1_i1:27-1004(+)
MTFPLRNIIGILRLEEPAVKPVASPTSWGQWVRDVTINCHLGHSSDFLVALTCYLFFFPLHEAADLHWRWIAKVIAFNLAIECIFYGGWHWFLYCSTAGARMASRKYNSENPYANGPKQHLFREITFTTAGWLISSTFQIVMMHLWASGVVPYYQNFWEYPAWSIGNLLFVTYWREFHFYWVHRMIHPWRVSLPVVGDPGKFLYRHVHQLHHKSNNPGPFSGLSMHPVEHLIYYTCTLWCLFLELHPLHFLYAKFHADIAPVGGHDGFAPPAGGADYHYLHHAKFECNYGVPLINFDKLFGTWVDCEQQPSAVRKVRASLAKRQE